MQKNLNGKKVAILVENGFEQEELTKPREALIQSGAEALIISPVEGKVRGWNHTEWGEEFPVDIPLSQANSGDFDALLLPGGVMNPDRLRMNTAAVAFVKEFFDANKPVGVDLSRTMDPNRCRVVNGRTVTSWPSIRRSEERRCALDRQRVVVDNGLVTSRKPADIPLNEKMIEEFSEGIHERKTA